MSKTCSEGCQKSATGPFCLLILLEYICPWSISLETNTKRMKYYCFLAFGSNLLDELLKVGIFSSLKNHLRNILKQILCISVEVLSGGPYQNRSGHNQLPYLFFLLEHTLHSWPQPHPGQPLQGESHLYIIPSWETFWPPHSLVFKWTLQKDFQTRASCIWDPASFPLGWIRMESAPRGNCSITHQIYFWGKKRKLLID